MADAATGSMSTNTHANGNGMNNEHAAAVAANKGRWASKQKHSQANGNSAGQSQQQDGPLQPAAHSSSVNVHGNSQQQKKQGRHGAMSGSQLSASAPVFVMSQAQVEDFVPSYRPPSQQPYQQVEQAQQQQQRQGQHQPAHQQQPRQQLQQQRNGQPRPARHFVSGQQQPQQQQPSRSLDELAAAAVSFSAQHQTQPQSQQSRGGRGGKFQRGEPRAPRGQQQQQRQQPQLAPADGDAPVSSSSAAPPVQRPTKNAAWRSGHVDNSQLAKAITEQLMTNTYECSICSEPIGRRGKIWSCTTTVSPDGVNYDGCHILLHATCIKKWYDANRVANLGDTSFRCPGCQFIRTEAPEDYRCFCGKIFEPEFSPYLTPHSCGQVCGRTRNCGVHTCNLPCHPGFCAKCTLPGPMGTCACGKTEHRMKCGEAQESSEKPTCGQTCGKPLACGHADHRCTRACHNGACESCSVTHDLTCFCGQVKETRACGAKGTVEDPTPANPDRISFSCVRPCGKTLDCGNHTCTQTCHPGACQPCARQPPRDLAGEQACACGKERHSLAVIKVDPKLRNPSPLKENANSWLRTSCRDDLPSCGGKCGRVLNCGFHTCTRTCHDPKESSCGLVAAPAASSSSSSSSASARKAASAPPSIGCNEIVKRQCRCAAANIVDVPCVQIRGDAWKGIPPPPASQAVVTCDTKCRAKLACRKHTCTNVCCPRGEQHLCVKVCGKPLACGQHRCDQFCHLGPCQPCGVIYREGLSCACGRTKTAPNARCGTTSKPVCPYPCQRVRPCGHQCVQTCHDGECAPCVTLVEKPCAGGHKSLASIPCYATPSCGITCKRLLRCGIHRCAKPCHTGKCTVPTTAQIGSEPAVASAQRKGWGMLPSSVASASVISSSAEQKAVESDEDDDDGAIRSCRQKCGLPRADCGHPCQRPCHPTSGACPTDAPCHAQVRIYCECRRLSKVVSCSTLSDPEAEHALECTPQCEVESRNARFREALSLDAGRVAIPYPAELLERVIELGLFEFALRVERMFGEFLTAGSSVTSKTFAPMSSENRWLVHQLAAYYNLTSESFDPEPRRTVRVLKTPLAGQPKMRLTDAIKAYRAAQATAAKANAAAAASTAAASTVQQSSVLHLFDLDQEPRISSSDLALALRPYANANSEHSRGGADGPQPAFRILWLDDAHAMVVFHDAVTMASVRGDLERRNLFRRDPDQLASEKALEVYEEGGYEKLGNSLWRKHSDAMAQVKKKAAAATNGASAFDSWSDARTSSSSTTRRSAWDSSSRSVAVGTSSSEPYTSDAMSEEELQAFIAKTALTDSVASQATATDSTTAASNLAPLASPSVASSLPALLDQAQAGVIALTKPKVVATHNDFAALLDDDQEDDEVEEGEVPTTTRKQRRRERAAAAAASASTAHESGVVHDWEAIAVPQLVGASRTHKAAAESDEPAPVAARDAFDD